MNTVIRHIERMKSCTDLIYSTQPIEEEIDKQLFYLMKKHWVFGTLEEGLNKIELNIQEYIRTLYQNYTNYTSRESIGIKKIKELSFTLASHLDTLPHKDLERNYNSIGPISTLLKCPSPLIAKSRYKYLNKNSLRFRQLVFFDFETFYKINWACELHELHDIKALEIKKAIAIYYIHESIKDIIHAINITLASYGLVNFNKKLRPIKHELRNIYATCSTNPAYTTSKGDSQSHNHSTDILNHCRPHPKGLYKSQLEEYLEELKDKFSIQPSGCSLKFFSAIAYILYDHQYSIGLQGDYKCFSKFKNDLGRYYGLDSNTYKPKDLIDIINSLSSDPIFNRINRENKH